MRFISNIKYQNIYLIKMTRSYFSQRSRMFFSFLKLVLTFETEPSTKKWEVLIDVQLRGGYGNHAWITGLSQCRYSFNKFWYSADEWVLSRNYTADGVLIDISLHLQTAHINSKLHVYNIFLNEILYLINLIILCTYISCRCALTVHDSVHFGYVIHNVSVRMRSATVTNDTR